MVLTGEKLRTEFRCSERDEHIRHQSEAADIALFHVPPRGYINGGDWDISGNEIGDHAVERGAYGRRGIEAEPKNSIENHVKHRRSCVCAIGMSGDQAASIVCQMSICGFGEAVASVCKR